MNIYEKLNKSRLELQAMNLKKSGLNKFSGYDYFELSDFLPKINEIFADNKLCAVVSFGIDEATLTIVDTEKPDDKIVIHSPMAGAELKGCHPIQNLGATETYSRRYLYLAALEIVEDDSLDKTSGKEKVDRSTGEDKSEPPKYRQMKSKYGSKEKPSKCHWCGKYHILEGEMIIGAEKTWGAVACYVKDPEEKAPDEPQGDSGITKEHQDKLLSLLNAKEFKGDEARALRESAKAILKSPENWTATHAEKIIEAIEEL
jgi:hypothetical protein